MVFFVCPFVSVHRENDESVGMYSGPAVAPPALPPMGGGGAEGVSGYYDPNYYNNYNYNNPYNNQYNPYNNNYNNY